MKQWIIIVLALCAYYVVTPLHAAIGTISTVTGTPGEIARNKQRIPGSAGSSVESNDIVTTKTGVTNITFSDDSRVRINENSRLLLDDFVYDPKKSDAGKLALKVGLGAVRFTSGQIAKTNPQQVAVKTPTATVSVRGTDFSMVVDEAGRSLIVLLPSCTPDQRPKAYELDENRCRVGRIGVTTLGGEVELDRAFQAVWVASSTAAPSKPVILNITESRVDSDLLINTPLELVRALLRSGLNTGNKNGLLQFTSYSVVEIEDGDTGSEQSSVDIPRTLSSDQSAAQKDQFNAIVTQAIRSAENSNADDITNAANIVFRSRSDSRSTQSRQSSAGSGETSDETTQTSESENNDSNNSTSSTSTIRSVITSTFNSSSRSTILLETISDLNGNTVDVASASERGESAAVGISNQLYTTLSRALLEYNIATGAAASIEEALQWSGSGTAAAISHALSRGVAITPQQLLQLLSALQYSSNLLSNNSTLLSSINSITVENGNTSNTVSYNQSVIGASSTDSSLGTNTVSTLLGATYTQQSIGGNTSTTIAVENASQLLASCDTITLVCITKDEQQQYSSTEGLLNNGNNPILLSSTLTISRTAESFDHLASVRLSAANSANHITLIQNDVLVSVQISGGVDVNTITINQRSRR